MNLYRPTTATSTTTELASSSTSMFRRRLSASSCAARRNPPIQARSTRPLLTGPTPGTRWRLRGAVHTKWDQNSYDQVDISEERPMEYVRTTPSGHGTSRHGAWVIPLRRMQRLQQECDILGLHCIFKHAMGQIPFIVSIEESAMFISFRCRKFQSRITIIVYACWLGSQHNPLFAGDRF